MNRKRGYLVRSVIFLLVMSGLFCISAVKVYAVGNVELDPELQKIVIYRYGESRENLTVVTDLVRASLRDPEKLLLLEKQFVSILESDAIYECKDFVCRQLWIMGTKESVPVLGKMLLDEKTSDMARYALERNECPDAGKALAGALGKVNGNVLIGVINSLGERRDEKSVKKLASLMFKPEKNVAVAAAAALGKIGNSNAEKALQKARIKGSTSLHTAASHALLVTAYNLTEEGKREDAATIYKSLCSLDEPQQIRRAALKGLERYLID